ncbi:MAG: hypothetical protein M1828_003605 [Chrysothrix sp. TS-e1954]|nr:MAG: hypothetical protein M1828_003605 [Chrysothrix sp. TS-e1954]
MISSPLKYPAALSDSDSDHARSIKGSLRSLAPTSQQHTHHWKGQKSWDSNFDEYDLTHGTNEAAQDSVSQHVTRDSMVEDLLLSFNEIPRGSGPLPSQQPIKSSFRNGQLVHVAAKKSLRKDRPPRKHSLTSDTGSQGARGHEGSRVSHCRSPPLPGSSPRQTSQPYCETDQTVRSELSSTDVQDHYKPAIQKKQHATRAQGPQSLDIRKTEKAGREDPTNRSYSLTNGARGHTRITSQSTQEAPKEAKPGTPRKKKGPLPSSDRSSFDYDRQRFAPPVGIALPRQYGSNSLVDAPRPKVVLSYPRTRTITGIIKSMADRTTSMGSHREQRSPSPSFDLNPQDSSRRRRSRSLHLGTSVLDRARPIPSEYHNFDEACYAREAKHNSVSHHASSSGERRSISDRNGTSQLPKSQTSHGYRSNTRDVGEGTVPDHGRILGTTALPPLPSAWKSSMSQSNAAVSKDRPNFFRRVFSSGKVANAVDAEPPQLPPFNIDARDADTNKTSQLRTPVAQPVSNSAQLPDMPPVPPDEHEAAARPVLHKKTSFFRRRKKTVNDKDGPLTVDTQKTDADSQGVHSNPSVSSLRKVMNPLLADGQSQSPQDKYFDSVERQPESPPPLPKHDVINQHSGRDSPARPSTQDAATSANDNARAPARNILHEAKAATTGHNIQTPLRNIDHRTVVDQKAVRSGARDTANLNPQSTSPDFGHIRAEPGTDAQQTRSNKGHWPQRSTSLNKRSRPAADASKASKRDMDTPEGSRSPEPLKDDTTTTPLKRKPDRIRLGDSIEPSTSKSLSAVTGLSLEDTSASERPSMTSTPTISRNVTPLNSKDAARGLANLPAGVSDAPNDNTIENLPAFDDQERAESLFNGGEDPATRIKGAVALGGSDEVSERVRTAYMSLFDFTGLNILLALRDLCERLVLKGETQQVDRVLASFSRRWCECNSAHGFKSSDVVHTICYSLLLLNTDLHVADMDQKMTRNQFVRNTLPTVKRIAEEDNSDVDTTIRPDRGSTRKPMPWTDSLRSPSPLSVQDADARPSLETRNSSSRLSVRQFHRPTSGVPPSSTPTPYDSRTIDVSELLVNTPYDGNIKGWEVIVETILKDSYTSIRQLRLPLHGASDPSVRDQPSVNSLSVVQSLMRRTGSITSKGGSSESIRGRPPGVSAAASRWASKNRSRPKLYTGSTFGSSRTGSRTSLEESLWSPSASSTWSRPSFGPTQSTMSTDSLASRYSTADPSYQQSIGFANALSHAIIREEGSMMPEAPMENNVPLLDDEELELAGAPWAKEGMVHHKHHLETTDKKFKDRTWYDNFAVVEKGWIRLFSFHKSSSSFSRTHKPSKLGMGLAGSSSGNKAPAPVVGGGNWTSNAEAVGAFMLRQTQAIILPSPGYSKTRPHVFALTQPNGAIHLFQVGTQEILREFSQTVNYWSARLSKEPLVGGVSNVEYGWGDTAINSALLSPNLPESSRVSIKESISGSAPAGTGSRTQVPFAPNFPPSAASAARGITHSPTSSQTLSISNRPSFQGSLRSRTSLDHNPTGTSSSFRRPAASSMPADRIQLSEWTPPQQSLYPSSLPEEDQLAALKRYVHSVDAELAHHNDLRTAMMLAYSPRSSNAAKALTNWERKSSHLLREIVKFKTYVDALEFAAKERVSVKSGERGVRGAMARSADEEAAVPPMPSAPAHLKGLSVDSQGDLDEGTLEALKIGGKVAGRGRTGTGGSSMG